MSVWLSFGGTIIVAIISLIGVIIQTKSKEKQDNIVKKIDELRKESKDGDSKLNNKMDNIRMNSVKRFLVSELSKIKSGTYIPNEEQKRMLKDAKDEYNAAGGDSYVDDMYDDLRDKHLI